MVETTLLHLLRRRAGGMETLLAEQQRIIVGLKSYGGKIENGQTPEENMCEEIYTEGGIIVRPEDIKTLVVIDFCNQKPFSTGIVTDPDIRMYCGITEQFIGTPKDSDEMKHARWYDIEKIPYRKHWCGPVYSQTILGDHLYLPDLLHKKQARGWILRDTVKLPNGNLLFLKIRGAHIWDPKTDYRFAVKALC